ncbi:helix-turn-helix domain-containing protein [Rhodoferax antarcticus]|uniref:helix-turn-helix domain-containing protein n=1 Tax=Rhodoferax antarcticus TaxID=81479 RepID=UPI00222406F9|nr:RodZ domain-containing protein [Rhodoferax antarcticus]MCW2311245.1 cytoskeleton protein RodZ [Rhodoferax antarcticus]
MSDEVFEGEVPAATLTQSSARAGAMLRAAREAQGLHIAALAVALKVSVKRLEALEAGRFEELPDMVFVRSLALSVCRSLKIDPTPIMASLPELQASPFKANETSLNATFKDSGGGSRRGVFAQVSTPIGLAVLALFVAIVVILTWPEMQSPFVEAIAPINAPEPALATELETLVPVEAGSAVESADGVPVTPAPLPSPVQTPVNSPGEVASKAAVASVGSAVVLKDSVLPVQPAVLELSGRGESWVEVTDAAGLPKLRKILANGEVVSVAGQLPLSVVVGRADVVSVSVRGKPFDLTPLIRENVARFEVK